MDTSQIKKFAIAARNILLQGVINKISTLGFDTQGHVTLAQMPVLAHNDTNFNGRIIPGNRFFNQWNALHQAIQQKGVEAVFEEVAYTWFNRLVAIRILQNQETQLITNVLDFVDDSNTPSIVNDARHGIFPMNMDEIATAELNRLLQDDTKTTEQFSILISAFCESTPMLRKIFGRIDDYTELLLPNNILAKNGFVDMLNNTEYITTDDYKQTELIGWLYQFYISERKTAAYKNTGEWHVEEVEAATQIFTPNWIVKYMVENTLGRIYIDNNPNSNLANDMKYLVAQSEGEHPIFEFEKLEDLRCADFSCGSGHILGEFFDLLYRIYTKEKWYGSRDAIESIFKYNLAGIDLDTRATQLSTFALLLKACQKDESFINAEVMPQVLDMPSVSFDRAMPIVNTLFLDYNNAIKMEISDAFKLMEKADELGSIMKFNFSDVTRKAIADVVTSYRLQENADAEIVKSLDLMMMLTDMYAAICMNPPYMGSGHMDNVLKSYVNKEYKSTKKDLFAVFMDVSVNRLSPKAKYGMINMQNWMFIISYLELRNTIISNYSFDSMIHLGPGLFDELGGEVVQSTSFIITKCAPTDDSKATYYRLIDGDCCDTKEHMFLEREKEFVGIPQNIFNRIPGNPIVYWTSELLTNAFANEQISSLIPVKKGMDTGDNEVFLRLWFEPSKYKVGICQSSSEQFVSNSFKWAPYNKGGKPQRRWYGLNQNVVLWENDGEELRKSTANLRSQHLYFKNAVTWNALATEKTTARFSNYGALFDSAGSSMFPDNSLMKYILGFMNSSCVANLLYILNPTMNFGAGSVGSLPLILRPSNKIDNLVEKNIEIAYQDWTNHEDSFEFVENPLIHIFKQDGGTLEKTINSFIKEWSIKFFELHNNEEELNRQFIDIYGLQDELSPEVPLGEVTILQQKEKKIENGQLKWDKSVILKQLISYAMGCWMGRYRLDRPGLHIAHPNPTEEELASYQAYGQPFEIDDDGIVPLMDEDAPFADNAVRRMKEFIAQVFGNENLATNLNYMNATLGRNMTLEKFFKNEFWKDHLARYSKRPIYWLFQSTRRDPAFQVLVYMHRMDAYTCEKVRSYLLMYIEYLNNRISYLENQVATAIITRELNQKRDALKECIEYELRLHDVANKQIAFDLDDGVKANYAKFGDVLAPIN